MKTFIKYEYKMKILSEYKIHLSINNPLRKHTVKHTWTEKQKKQKKRGIGVPQKENCMCNSNTDKFLNNGSVTKGTTQVS